MTIGIAKTALPSSASGVSGSGNVANFLTQNRFGYDAIEVAGGGGVSLRTSLGVFQGLANVGTAPTGSAPTDTLPSTAHYATTNVAGNSSGFQGGSLCRLKQLASLKFRLQLNQGTQCRIWIAFTSGNMAGAEWKSDDPGNANNDNGVGWRYSTAAGDGTWQGCVWQHLKTISTVDTHIVPDTSAFHTYEIAYNGTSVLFKYDGAVVAIQNNNLPIGTPPVGTNYSMSAGVVIDNVALGNIKSFEYSSSYAALNSA